MNQDKKKQRYVVLPGTGTSGPAMQSAVFKGGGAALTQAVSNGLDRFRLESSNAVVANASLASAELAGSVLDQDFEVISQRFDDGPALVAMTQAARLALEASHPDLRVFSRHALLPAWPKTRPIKARPERCADRGTRRRRTGRAGGDRALGSKCGRGGGSGFQCRRQAAFSWRFDHWRRRHGRYRRRYRYRNRQHASGHWPPPWRRFVATFWSECSGRRSGQLGSAGQGQGGAWNACRGHHRCKAGPRWTRRGCPQRQGDQLPRVSRQQKWPERGRRTLRSSIPSGPRSTTIVIS